MTLPQHGDPLCHYAILSSPPLPGTHRVTKVTYLQRTVALPQTLPQPMRDNHLERDSMDIGTTLMLSILFGSIGAGYFLYGKKQQQFADSPGFSGKITTH